AIAHRASCAWLPRRLARRPAPRWRRFLHAGSQHAARTDTNVVGARTSGLHRHVVRRLGFLDGGARPMRRLSISWNLRTILTCTTALALVGGAGAAAYFLPLKTLVAHTDVMDLTASAGLRLENLTVEGRENTNKDDLLAALDIERGAPILAIDVS